MAVPKLMPTHDHDHHHDHQVVPSDPALRTKALESLLVEKGLVDRAALDALVDAYENKIGPHATALAWWRAPGWIRHIRNGCSTMPQRQSPNWAMVGHRASTW